jgi:hypothetical protein
MCAQLTIGGGKPSSEGIERLEWRDRTLKACGAIDRKSYRPMRQDAASAS